MVLFKQFLLINKDLGMKTRVFISILALAIWFLATASSNHSANQDQQKGLKDYYASYFPIGVAVSPSALKSDEGQLILTQFNSMTAENVMKVGPIHPEENKFNWGPADEIVKFAQANSMKMRGHTLCWHNQLPKWMFIDQKG